MIIKVAYLGEGMFQVGENDIPYDETSLKQLASSFIGLSDVEAQTWIDTVKQSKQGQLEEKKADTGVIVDMYEVDYPTPTDPMKTTEDLASHLDERKDFVTQTLFPGNKIEDVTVGLTKDLLKGQPQQPPVPKNASQKLSWEVREINPLSFFKLPKKEGIVLLGAGGDLNEWIDGVTKNLNELGVVQGTPEEIWDGFYKLTTTGGRIDLAMPFRQGAKFDLGKMAMWRLQFGDCSWISDYIDNYKNQHQASQRGWRMVLSFAEQRGSGFFDPSGNWYSVPFEMHEEWAQKKLEQAGNEGLTQYQSLSYLLKQGWVRVSKVPGGDINIQTGRFTQNTKDTLIEYISNLNEGRKICIERMNTDIWKMDSIVFDGTKEDFLGKFAL